LLSSIHKERVALEPLVRGGCTGSRPEDPLLNDRVRKNVRKK